jgi:hypothetical protein
METEPIMFPWIIASGVPLKKSTLSKVKGRPKDSSVEVFLLEFGFWVHPANEYASFQKRFHPWVAEDDPKGFSSIPRLPVWSFQGVTDG